MRWQDNLIGIDWNALSELYRIAPLGEKSPDGGIVGQRECGGARQRRARKDERPYHVFWTTMLGNFAEKSAAFSATEIATLRAMSR